MNLMRLMVAAFACMATAAFAQPKLVAYFNETGPRVEAAKARLLAALRSTGVGSRHDVRIRHYEIDIQDEPGIRKAIAAAVADGAVALLAGSGIVARACREVTQTVPVVFGSHQDPVQQGLVRSIREPGGNLTGFTFYHSIELKRLELLREISPAIRNVGILVDKTWYLDPGSRNFALEAKNEFGIVLHEFPADTPAILAWSLERPRAWLMDAWYVPNGFVPFDHPGDVARALAPFRKPAVYVTSAMAEHGGLASYQAVVPDPFSLWITMLGMVLDGVPPASIPVERPKDFELAVNLRTAREQGIAIPRSLLRRATRTYN